MGLKNAFHRYLVAACAAIGISAYFLPGGFDLLNFYLRIPLDRLTVPAWVYLFTTPLSWLPWPASYALLAFLTALLAGVTARASGGRRWWPVLVCLPMVDTLWLGQIEILPIAGLLAGWLVIEERAHPAWMGVSWVLLASKPQIGAGLGLFLTLQMIRRRGFRSLAWAALPAAGLVGLSFAFWPDWPARWLRTLGWFYGNASLWPWGLLAWIPALLGLKADPRRGLRMFGAATLLGSPYFTIYHCTPLYTLVDEPLLAAASYLPLLLAAFVPENTWTWWFWLIPAVVLAWDTISVVEFQLARRIAQGGTTS